MNNMGKLKTACALGLNNIWFVFLHKIKIKCGLLKFAAINVLKNPIDSVYFTPVKHIENTPEHLSNNWQQQAVYFGWLNRKLEQDKSPDWFQFEGFNDPLIVDDIKLIWDASRFSWLFPFVQRILKGDLYALDKMNVWIEDWSIKNPPYVGVNWMCGQEAAIRVLHLAMSALMLRQIESVQTRLIQLIEVHIHRIALTLRYAIAQDNNHGFAEAAALFVGGSWLCMLGLSKARKWEKLGQKWLNNRVAYLIASDGSTSQYSVNYHRTILDICSMVKLWCQHTKLHAFTDESCNKINKSIEWLASMTNRVSGDAPYVGAYDGSRLLPLMDAERDFRISVQLASVLFNESLVYSNHGSWNDVFSWLDIPMPAKKRAVVESKVFDSSGFAILTRKNIKVLMRYPRFYFRPSQCDILHVDLWVGEDNHLRDAGTYSYCAKKEAEYYFTGTHGHNTIQFDDRDQMPRISRFLFGDWLKTEMTEALHQDDHHLSFAAAYRDKQGAYHKRKLILYDDAMIINDYINGFKKRAVLRWRLLPLNWKLDGNKIQSEAAVLTIEGTMSIKSIALVQGWESRYYLHKSEAPILEVVVEYPGQIRSEYRWSSGHQGKMCCNHTPTLVDGKQPCKKKF